MSGDTGINTVDAGHAHYLANLGTPDESFLNVDRSDPPWKPAGRDVWRVVTTQLLVYGVLGIVSTAVAFRFNRRLFVKGGGGHVTVLEGLFYVFGLASLGLGWYFNVRYTHLYGHQASYVNYTKALFSNWASDSAAQDYIMLNVVLLPLWTIVDGRRRGLRLPWIFFVMSLFTSLAFSMAMYLAFVERQIRYGRSEVEVSKTSKPQL
jgi:hypothetical protein